MEARRCRPKNWSFGLRRSATASTPSRARNWFERKLRRHRKLHAQLGELLDTQQQAIAYLERVEIEYLLQRAALTPRQRYVCEQYLNGLTLREIGKRMGVSKQAAAKTLKFALVKLKRAWRNNPFHGLAEVYRREVSRIRLPTIGSRNFHADAQLQDLWHGRRHGGSF